MSNLGNVLVVGSEGVGKSTLIRAVLGSNAQATPESVRGELPIYEQATCPFRVLDAGNLGGGFFQRHHTISAIRHWSKAHAMDGNTDNDVNVIWFCVEGKSRKLIRQQMAHLSRATDIWRTVPIIVVLTKSYTEVERADNIALVRQACARRRRLARCLADVIPVVATTYSLDETTFVAPVGITKLIETTTKLLPSGVRAAQEDIVAFGLKRKRSMARGIVVASTAAGVTVGAAPIPISDALILTSVEAGMIGALAKLYDIGSDSASKNMLATILEAGTVSTAAKTAISALKAVPGINLAASVINAAIAGSVVAIIGEGSTRVFERIYRGEKTIDDTEWAKQFMESKVSKDLVAQGTKLLGQVSGTGNTSSQNSSIVALLKDQILNKKASTAE